MGSATKALKRFLRFMVRRSRACRSKTQHGKIPLEEIPQLLSETSTTINPLSEYQPLETVVSRVHTYTEVTPTNTIATPAPQQLFDDVDIGVLLQPEKHTCKEEPIYSMDGESLGFQTDDLLCDFTSEGNAVPTTDSKGPVALVQESLHLPEGEGIKGTIQVTNVAYEKRVTVRWSVDGWKTWADTDATFHSSISKDSDLFEFTIPSQTKTEFAVRYQAAGQEVWDNNSGWNYQFSPNMH